MISISIRRVALASVFLVAGVNGACGDAATSSPANGGAPDAASPDAPVSPTPDGAVPDPDASPSDPDAAGDAETGTSIIDVNGRVHFSGSDLPVAGATVKAGGKTTTTASDGKFTLAGVAAPYDLVVAYDVAAKPHIYAIDGLTSATPEIEAEEYSPDPVVTSKIQGTVSRPGGFPLPADHSIVVVTMASANSVTKVTIPAGAANGDFSIDASWQGPATVMKTLYAIELTKVGGAPPSAFDGFGKVTASATSAVTTTGANITLVDVPESSKNVTVAHPTPIESEYAAVAIVLDRNTSFEFGLTSSTSFSATAPSIAGATTAIYAGGAFPDAGGSTFDILPVDGVASVALDTRSALSATPLAGASYSATVPFAWDPKPSGVFQIRDRDANGAYVFTHYTKKSSVAFPPGFTPSSGTHKWRLAHYPRSTPDSFVSGENTSFRSLTRFAERTLVVP